MKLTKRESAFLAYMIGDKASLNPSRIKQIEALSVYNDFKHDPYSFDEFDYNSLFKKLCSKAEKK